MAVSSPHLSLLFLVAAAASLHFLPPTVDARATPESHYRGGPAVRSNPYDADSAITAADLYKIESQFDNDDEEVKKVPSSTSTNYVADPYRFGNDPLHSTNQYAKSNMDGYKTNDQTSTKAQSYSLGGDFYPSELGSRQQEPSRSTTAASQTTSTKAQSNTANDFGTKQQQVSSSTQSNPNTYGSYASSNNYYTAGADAKPSTDQYWGMSDTRRPENQRMYFSAAKGLGTTSKVADNGDSDGTTSYRHMYNNNRQSQNEFATMQEYYNSQGIEHQP